MIDLTKRSSYDYDLPEEQIAQKPLADRAESRLLVMEKESGEIMHGKFSDIMNIFQAGDVLVVNKTKVIPARLLGNKPTGAKAEVFLLNQLSETRWKCLVKPGRKLHIGAEIIFSDTLKATIVDNAEEGGRVVEFSWEGDFWEVLDENGNMPLPPYIKRESTEDDNNTYQTVYAQDRGSVAAPTAGLHFTTELMDELKKMDVEILEVTLHVGLGTFRPVKADSILDHKMHSEYCTLTPEVAERVNAAKKAGRRVIAVGTTSTRTLESFAEEGKVKSGSHNTDIFIYPGKKVQIIDGLITNFHMPESTLMMLVSAFAGYENIMKAYKIAVNSKYRFFSYGDAMLII